MKSDIKECIKAFTKALKEKNAAIFAGAGLSKASGYVDWKELMRDIASDLGLDVDNESDLIAIAQYHINDRFGNRSIINQNIIDHFTKQVQITENHKILSSIPVSSFWTTNYDKLIEDSLEREGKTVDVKRIAENMFITIPKRDAIVYKMHGDISQPNDAVLTKEDYETYETSRKAYSIVLQSDLLSKTFLFIGFSFDDPNLIYILSRIKNLLGPKNIRTHYCFFKKETDKEKQIKQELKLKDLSRYGIKSVVIDDYPEITNVLKAIRNHYKNSQIFISGAAEEFDEFGEEKRAKQFIHDLGKKLTEKGYKLISGFGYKVGSGIINGALDYAFSTNYRNIDEYIKLRPFPQYYYKENLSDDELKKEKSTRNNKYRELMISEAGLAIYIFGNKKNSSGDVVNSKGMYREFEIAKSLGVKPIPIGCTGYLSKQIWQEVMDNFDSYYNSNNIEIKKWLTKLGETGISNETIFDCILNIIQKLNTDINY